MKDDDFNIDGMDNGETPPEGTTFDRGWKNAMEVFNKSGFKIGEMIPMAWFYTNFRVTPLEDCHTADDFKETQFKFMGEMSMFQQSLAEENQLVLQNIRGEGYRIVPPAEQTAFAMDKAQREMNRVFSKAHMRLTNIRLDELSDEQRRQNADSQAKLAALRTRARRVRLPE